MDLVDHLDVNKISTTTTTTTTTTNNQAVRYLFCQEGLNPYSYPEGWKNILYVKPE